SMAVTATIKQNASARINENIQYDFGTTPHHGILRDIPLTYASTNGAGASMRISGISVVDETGRPYPFTTSESGGILEIKIGDPNILITGSHTYDISYVANPVVAPYADFDEFYWNATGDRWQVPIASSSAMVILPTQVDASQIRAACYTGVRGSTNSCTVTTHLLEDGRTAITFSGPSLSPGEGLTVAAGFPKGIVKIPTAAALLWMDWMYTFIALAVLVVAIVFAAIFAFTHRAKGRGVIIPVYEPPGGLRPAEADVLVHGRVGKSAWPATVIDLAVRGYLKIEEQETGWGLFKSKTYVLQRSVKGVDGIGSYEANFLEALFGAGDTFSTKELRGDVTKSQALYQKIKHIEDDLRSQTALDTAAYLVDPETVAKRRAIVRGVGIMLFIFSYAATYTNVLQFISPDLLTAGVLIIAAVLTAIYPVLLRPRLNPAGAKECEDWLGFKLYLETAEKYRLQNLTPDQFQAFLPYAMIFGVEKKWASAFTGLAMPPPNWYAGPVIANGAVFSPVSFTSTFTSSFASSFAATGAGGASGGGGGAGGGGGGGGGGGW
ncbi:MAG: DUF2207 domain-containing protein, partial [Patescibacteria group bacterium]|nr:DUF2207 domain-containing protein [Patescibacteria group bacterium]